VHVGDDARQDEKGSASGKHPANLALSVPEEDGDAKEHWNERDPKGIRAVEAPVRSDHTDLVCDPVAANTSHDDPDHEFAESAAGSTYVTEISPFHRVLPPLKFESVSASVLPGTNRPSIH
jgi:hypothetical protein